MAHVPTVLRILLGLAFVVFGLNYFLDFLPPQPMKPGDAMMFMGALVVSKVMAVVKIVEVTAGLLLLANRFVPLALALLAPIIVGINVFHFALAPEGAVVGVVVLVIELVLAWAYRDAFAPMLRARVSPAPRADGTAIRSVDAPARA